MSREVDLREPAGTGNVTRLDAVDTVGTLAESGGWTARALEHVRAVAPALGLAPAQPAEFLADPIVPMAGSGARTVHLHQHYQGVRIFQAGQAVHFDPAGAVTSTAGDSVTVEEPPDPTPTVRVEAAVHAAARHVATPGEDETGTDQFGEPFHPPAVELDGFDPVVTSVAADSPERPAVLAAGPFAGPVTARLTWFPLRPGDLRLAWQVTLTMPGQVQQFVVVVDARTAEILYAHQTVLSAAAVGKVFLVDGDGPRQEVDFPRALADYRIDPPPGLPAGFPDDWLRDADTSGTAVTAHFGDRDVPVLGRRAGDRLVFDPHPDSDEQRVVNLFALASSAHDLFYLLGFTEAEGNFQHDSLGRGGVGSDPVDGRVFPGAVAGTASMLTPADGTSPVMRMGLVTATGRHTALDATVVLHEFTHGVTNRLVGGGWNTHALDEIQSAGMGEGWSDFFACLHLGTDVIGAWVVNRPGGIRGARYDAGYPGDFGQLGRGRYTGVHAIGEIWCATLLEATRRLGSEQLAMQLVVDALKLSRANPGFLDMRDAMLTALADKRTAGQLTDGQFAAAEEALWGAFARFGMGPGARSLGARLDGIHADFDVPARREEAPAYMVTVVLNEDGIAGSTVVPTDGDGIADPWTGADGDRRIQYFVDHPATHGGGRPSDVRLEIVDREFGMLDSSAGGPDRLTARMRFTLDGADAGRTTATYLAHVVATSEESDEAKVLTAQVGVLHPGETTHEVTLEFTAPAPGRYQLLAAVILVDGDVIGVEAGPPLQVIP